MPFIQLTGGAYQTRSLIAAAQRCLNLFPEATPKQAGEPIQVTHYCAPGLTLQNTANISPLDNGCRGLYTASNGDLYACYDQHLLHYSSSGVWTDLGTFHPSAPSDAAPRDNFVVMQDNGFVLILVDGTVDGYFVDISQPVAKQTLTRINRTVNTGWLGADNISFQDTFFLMNSPGTTDWYISLSNITSDNLTAAFNVFTATLIGATSGYVANDVLTLTGTGGAQVTINSVDNAGAITGYGVTNGGALTTQPANPVAVTGGTGTGATFNLTYQTNVGGFDPLDFVSMEAQVTKCVAAVSIHRNVWILGETAYEIWINTGGDGTQAGSFPFQIYPTGYGNWGCTAKYSTAVEMNRLFWVSQDKYGHGIVMMGEALAAKRISTHAIEFEISQYPSINDAIGYCYQQLGHVFYVLTFPSAHNGRGATWVYDSTTNEWHERCYIDSNGIEYRHLGNAATGAYNQVWIGDWRNGNLYTFDLDNYTDNGNPIKRLRSFPHQIDLEANRRVMYHQLIAQMQVGSPGQTEAAATFLDCQFNAPDSTLLQNYHNINSFGANFLKIDPVDAIIFNDAVIGQTAGPVLYQVAGAPRTANYVIRYKVKPTEYTSVAPAGTIISIIGRATADFIGYEASIYSDGSQYFVSLTVGIGSPRWIPLGTLTSGDYELYLSMQSTAITVQVYRSEDGQWLTSSGTWSPSVQTAIAITDNTYTTPGLVLIAGNWGGAGQSVGIDPSVSATASVGDLTVDAANLTIILNLMGFTISSAIGSIGDDLSQVIEIISQDAAGLAVEANAQIGALSVIEANFITIGIAGVQSASAPGTFAVSAPQSIALSGVESATTVGTPGITESSNVTFGLSGLVSTSAFGTFAVSAPQSLMLTGVASVGNPGTPGVQKNNTVSIGLAGLASPISVGSFTPLAQKSISTTGVASTTGIGTISVSGISFSMSGVQTTSGLGTLTVSKVQNRSPLLPSVQAATQINAPLPQTVLPQGLVTANLASINNAQPVWSAYIADAGIGPYEFLPASTISYDSLTNAGVRTNINSLGFTLMRIHVGNEQTIMQETFPTSPGNTGQNWTQFDELFASLPHIVNLAATRLILTGGVKPSWCDVTTSTGCTQYGNMMAQIAARAVLKGCEIFYWEPYNEPDGGKVTSPQYATLHVAVAQALKSYATTNSRGYYNVGGPCIQEVPYSTWIHDMVTACVGASVPVDFLSWHDYPTGSLGTVIGWPQYVTLAQSRAGTAHTGVTQATGASGTISSSIPCCMTEWNMSFDTTTNGDPWATDIHGAVWGPLYIYTMMTQQSGANMQMMAWYESAGDGNFGIVRSTTVAPASIAPVGYAFSRLNSRMPGSQVVSTVNPSLSGVYCIATTNGSNFGLMLINTNLSTAFSNVTVSVNGYAGSSLSVWQISSAALQGGAITTTPLSLASSGIALPPLSVTVISQS